MSEIACKNFRHSKFDHQSDDFIIHWGGEHWGGEPLEIGSGAISHLADYEKLFQVQANTSEGLWNFIALQESKFSLNDIQAFLDDRAGRHIRSTQWNTRRPSLVYRTHGTVTLSITEPSVANKKRIVDSPNPLEDRQPSPSELLEKLRDSSISQTELFETILFAEIAAFDEPQTKALLPLLFEFVNNYRFSQDEDTKTAVGAAIRKLAMNLQDSEIEQYAKLFHPTETDTLSCEIELELAKAILWRLSAQPSSLVREFPNLENCLVEIASLYLNSRLLLQKNYASIALQAILGVLLLNSQHADQIMQRVRDMKISWFSDLLVRRLKRLRAPLRKINQSEAIAAATNLERFMSVVQCDSN